MTLSFAAADPYLNTDAGTMSPFEHGEVFVLDDGGEVGSAVFHHNDHLQTGTLQKHLFAGRPGFGKL